MATQPAYTTEEFDPEDFTKVERSKYVYTVSEVPLLNLTEVSKTHMIASDRALLSFITNPPGTTFPLHSHEAEQILIILEGSEEHVVGDERFLLKAGDVCIHPSNVRHGGKTETGFKGIDIFLPPREDYLELMRQHGLPTRNRDSL